MGVKVMRHHSFTMLELVFVIVVVGILAAALMPRLGRDNAGEAAYQIARHIRLAQHHALIEDRYGDPSADKWEATLWRIQFRSGTDGECYSVYTDRNANGGVPAQSERAVDPLTRKYVWANTNCRSAPDVNDDVLLWKNFGIETVRVCGRSGAKHIAFDHLGRPGRISLGTFSFIPLSSDCTVHLSTSDGHNADIVVYRETGFVKVAKIDGVDIP